MKKILENLYISLQDVWHIPVGILIALCSMWAGALFLHVCPRWMEVPGIFTTIVFIAVGIIIACKDIDWGRQY
jgi:hypothetical protein